MLPLCCCGGLLLYSFTVNEVTIRNGEHLGGSPMNVKFDYEFPGGNHGPRRAYFIVVRSADGTTRERPITEYRIPVRGSFMFHAMDIGPNSNVQGPVKVWMESSGLDGGRRTASNTLTVATKK